MLRLFFLGVALILGIGATFALWDRFGPRPAPPLPVDVSQQIDHILIEKSARRLTASRKGKPVMSLQIALGFAPKGDKSQEGDGKTPEGMFTINRRNPNSAFHLSLGLDYPLPHDIAHAKAAGIDPGGDIFIHGQPNGVVGLTLPGDWTAGCIAISNQKMRTLWQITPIGTAVDILP
ncbi:hypothetical protein DS909_21635 [Phaeobacter gallaeciensis]|uniref:L,D-TPase catalytic domain-containing protein n=2 Tax=Roseobacteraceae TaxID=2854170 RepID=A0A366WL25_9RHOB|nr:MULTISPECIES: L,D-transpeptidase family protein [Roseobacteraceae]MBT3140176.1 L,D-transpeptidase family protein [Falsiruegeria litorea]MBT8169065.1 L,D-transpeptidase family protein [Falsiruegeria litorea]RBW50514.1 hypothetical protein DS909_21635 [Phaeobacter gallaeciensis]